MTDREIRISDWLPASRSLPQSPEERGQQLVHHSDRNTQGDKTTTEEGSWLLL